MATRTLPSTSLTTLTPVRTFDLPSEGADNLYGTDLADTINGLGGNDTIHGGGGNDHLFGDYGNDRLFGDAGNDTLDGGYGDDTLIGGAGADTLNGGRGTDTVSYSNASIGVTLDLANGGVTNDAAGDTYSGIENITGSAFGDLIAGNASANVIDGGNGGDFLFGMAGNDQIDGGNGNDTLRGGAGNDILVGGVGDDRMTGDDAGPIGNDTFVLDFGPFEFSPSGTDIVTDFQHGHDKLSLPSFSTAFLGRDGRLATGSDNLGWSNFNAPGLGIGDWGDSLAFNVENHTLYDINWHYIGDGQYTSSFVAIAVLEGVTTLSNEDFLFS